MNVTIRQEIAKDYQAVFDLIVAAFEKEVYSDHKEQFLVDRLRSSTAFIPELSLVAEKDEEIVGHILLTKITIESKKSSVVSLALAPVSVLPKYHGQGVGSLLIQKAHNIAGKLGYGSVVLLGHKDYYPRFGYKQAHCFGISLPFDVPKENCMAIELSKDSLSGVSGTVKYDKAFYQ